MKNRFDVESNNFDFLISVYFILFFFFFEKEIKTNFY